MTYYKAYYGNWRGRNSVKIIGGSFSRKEIFAKARKVANETGETVTVHAEMLGGRHEFSEVKPQQEGATKCIEDTI